MNKSNTDRDWEAWGKENPYYGVLTDPKFLNANLNSAALDEFFSSGEQHIANLWQYIRTRIRGDFAPRRVLDYGCGAGRLVIPFARRAQDVVGIDVSRSVLEEARENCSRFELDRVKLLHLDQIASLQPESFDLVHSVMVFQHIPVRRGEILLQKILDLLAGGGSEFCTSPSLFLAAQPSARSQLCAVIRESSMACLIWPGGGLFPDLTCR